MNKEEKKIIKLEIENKKLKDIIKKAKKYVNILDYDIESVTYNKKTNYYEDTIGIMKKILNGGEDNE